MENALNLDTVVLAENEEDMIILDQTLLPNEERYLLPSFTLFPMLLCCLICLSDFRPGRQEEVPQAETPAAPLPESETPAAEPTA